MRRLTIGAAAGMLAATTLAFAGQQTAAPQAGGATTPSGPAAPEAKTRDRAAIKQDRAAIRADLRRLKADRATGKKDAVQQDRQQLKQDRAKLLADGGGHKRRK